MPKPRKPLAMQKGNLTVLQQTEMQQQEDAIIVGREQLSKPPPTLIDSIAKKEFKRIVKEFDNIKVIGNLDINNIVGYCNAYSFYLKSTKELKNSPLTVEKITKNGEVTVRNPLIDIQKSYAEEMRKFGSLCGLTIDSRLKVGAIKTTRQAQDINSKFGDI